MEKERTVCSMGMPASRRRFASAITPRSSAVKSFLRPSRTGTRAPLSVSCEICRAVSPLRRAASASGTRSPGSGASDLWMASSSSSSTCSTGADSISRLMTESG